MDAHQSWLEAPYDAAAKVQAEYEDAHAMYYDEADAVIQMFDFNVVDSDDVEKIEALINSKDNNEMLGMALRELVKKVADKAATEAADKAEANGYQ